ncbi:MAG: hypothetical protein ABIQ16_21125 [Polyangiaceae bacterium]
MDSIGLALLMLGVVSIASPLAAEPAPGTLDCASVTASTRLQATGYAHVVTLANHCSRAVSCEVWTDVDPSPRYTLSAKPGETAETITRAGSPSRVVQAGKSCHFASSG